MRNAKDTKKPLAKDQKSSSSPSGSRSPADKLLASMGKREDEIPEVSGERKTAHASSTQDHEPDDEEKWEATARSFTSTQEEFLQRLLLKAATEMATTHQQAWLRQETELQQMKDKLENLQATQHNRPTTMMETPRAIRPQDVEYQSLLDTAKRLKEKNAEEAERPPYAYQNRHLNSFDDTYFHSAWSRTQH